MLHFYTYYSIGGYKDMYLGNSGMTDVAQTYYLPLLPSMKQKANSGDKIMQEKVEKLEELAKIELLTKDSRYGLPVAADSLITHSGYKVIYMHLESDKHIVVLRDIQGKGKDENGRAIPFLLAIMCDAASDVPLLDRLATYLACNTQTAENKFVSFLHYDVNANGLCFELKAICEWITSLPEPTKIQMSLTNKTSICGCRGKVAMVVATTEKNYLINELSIALPISLFLPIDSYLPIENSSKAADIKNKWEEHERQRKMCRNIVIAVSTVSAIAAGGLLIYLLCKNG